ncbi:MAG: winged helix-turn-helix transcriptional regulator [Anaerolineales bacterium]|nr:winged helix-turn-helix transcriptional regulator [Anaerolineales bacterium]
MISDTLDRQDVLKRADILSEDIGDDSGRELILLEQIEGDPDVTQATLAAQLGVAVGTINWHIKRLIAKGYLKVKRAQRRKLRYIITPEGLAFRALLTVNYIETSLRLYRKTRQRVLELLDEVQKAGYDYIQIDGDGDLAEICRLTCLEQGIREVKPDEARTTLPTLEVRGAKIILRYGPVSVEEQ